MSKFWTKKRKNLFSLIVGIILILSGASGTSISLINLGLNKIAIAPIVVFIIGIFLGYMGSEEKW